MKEQQKKTSAVGMLGKSVGMIVAPLTFAILLALGIYGALHVFVGDVSGYAQVLFMRTGTTGEELTDLFVPSEKNGGTVDIHDITIPVYETVYGQIRIDSVGIDCPLLYGDSNAAIRKGAGQYIGSTLIGYGGTTLICAHVNRHFANLSQVQVGDKIQIDTTYGAYTYRVTHAGVHTANDKTVYDLARDDENVVLYTCYYEYTALGSVKKRFFVCADYESGPMIVDREATE